MSNSAAIQENYTHRVTYKGNTRLCNQDNYSDVVNEMIALYGSGAFPQFEALNAGRPVAAAQVTAAPVPAPVPAPTPAGEVDLAGKLRATADQYLAEDSGFAPKPPVYSIGTRVNETGVENARAMQLDHDGKPYATELAGKLVAQVKAEERQDLRPQFVSDLYMSSEGLLVLPSEEGPGGGPRYPLSKDAFGSLFSRFPCGSGLAYLSSCPQKLRSINFNHWSVHLRNTEDPKKRMETVLRTRNGAGGRREVFASVSPTYTAFDADKIGEALRLAFPEDARGTLDYDGRRVRLEGLWRSDVAAEQYVAGEIFKAGVIVRSDDTGGGSIRVQSVIWRNLCLNLIILDKAVGVDIRIRHSGSVRDLARRFREAFAQALGSVEGFRRSWGYAFQERDEKFLERVQGTTSEKLGTLSPEAALPGIFNGILQRDLVPVRGRKSEVIPKLLEMHAQDEAASAYGVSRASVVNAFTRYAHQVEVDPFAADEIREGAGRLLSSRAGRAPSPLPYVPFAGASE